jgi:hypothetical protein
MKDIRVFSLAVQGSEAAQKATHFRIMQKQVIRDSYNRPS